MAASREKKGGGDPLPNEQKVGGDRSLLSQLTGLMGFSGGGEAKTPTEDYNCQVRNDSGSYWLEVVENVSKWSVSREPQRL